MKQKSRKSYSATVSYFNESYTNYTHVCAYYKHRVEYE